jgi:hypothetical protein
MDEAPFQRVVSKLLTLPELILNCDRPEGLIYD